MRRGAVRIIGAVLLLLGTVGWLACGYQAHEDHPKLGPRSTATARPYPSIRPMSPPPSPPLHQPPLHPSVVAALEAMLSLMALIAFSTPLQDERPS
jgi:hypothetical protein